MLLLCTLLSWPDYAFLFIWILNKKKMVTVATAQSKQWRLRLRNYKHHGSFCAKSSICDLPCASPWSFPRDRHRLYDHGPRLDILRTSMAIFIVPSSWTPVNIPIIFRLPIFIFIFILHLCAHSHRGCTITTVRCHVRHNTRNTPRTQRRTTALSLRSFLEFS